MYNTRKIKNMNDLIEIDLLIINVLEKRLSIISDVKKFKRENNISVMQYGRIDEMINSRIIFSSKYNISNTFIHDLFIIIIEKSCDIQKS